MIDFSEQISGRLRTLIVALIIAALIAILYGPGLNYPFFFDDYNSLMNDQGQVSALIKNPAQALDNLLSQPLRPDRNLTWLSFATNYKLTKMNPSGFRVINLVLHGLCSFLIYLLLTHLLFRHNPKTDTPANDFRICGPALFGALFFLCHPLSLNTVLYISQRFGALAAFFYLLGFYAWLKGSSKISGDSFTLQTRRNRGHDPYFLRRIGSCPRFLLNYAGQLLWFSVTGLAFWAAIHCKEMAITLPLTILIYELYTRKPLPDNRKKSLSLLALIFLIIVIFFLFAWQIGLFNQSWINIGFRSKRLWSPGIQFLSEARAFFHYWQILFLPLPKTLSLHHEFSPSPGLLDPTALFAVLGHFFLLGTAWKMRQKNPLIGFGILWFYLILGPPYLFLPQKELLVEYKTYLATPGAALIICGVVTSIENRLQPVKRVLASRLIYIILGCWLILLTSITWQRQPVFQNQITLWSDVLQKYPTSRRALNNRAVAHLKNKNPKEALTDLDTLVKNYPDYARGFENRGRLRFYLKDYRGAVTDLQKTLNLLPHEPELENTINQITKLKNRAQRAAQKENKR